MVANCLRYTLLMLEAHDLGPLGLIDVQHGAGLVRTGQGQGARDRQGQPADRLDAAAGAVVVCDAKSLQEVRRLPMVKPSGKYNVHNKITRSAGTSH